MRVGTRAGLISGKICMALLLGMLLVAMMFPRSDVAFGQTGTETAAKAPLFKAIDLNSPGFTYSEAFGTSDGKQVGVGSGSATNGQDHALLWRGSANSVVDLNPPGFTYSEAFRVCGGQQVGRGYGPATKNALHALLWRGSATSVVDLHVFLPPGFVESQAMGIDTAGDIVGYASSAPWTTGTYPPSSHAFLWRRTAQGPGTSRDQNTMRC